MNKTNKSTAAQMIFTATLLTLFIPILSFSQNVSYQNTVLKQQNPILFEIEKDGKISHILGSMHAGIPLDSYPDIIYQLADQSKYMAFEADLESYLKKKSPLLVPESKYSPGQNLDQDLSNEAVSKLKQLYGEKSYEIVREFKPKAVSNNITKKSFENLVKNSPENLWNNLYGIDSTLLKKSKSEGKKIIYLDDEEALFKSQKMNTGVEYLEKLLSQSDPANYFRDCALLAQSTYMTGKLAAVKNYNENCETETLLKESVVRNFTWVPKLEPLLKKGGAFITVGSSHMTGQNSLESLLRAKGYSVKRIGGTPANNQRPIYGYGDSLGEPERKFLELGSNQ